MNKIVGGDRGVVQCGVSLHCTSGMGSVCCAVGIRAVLANEYAGG